MKLSKTTLLLISLLILLVGVASYLVYRLFVLDAFRVGLFVKTTEEREVEEAAFNTSDYIMPLDQNSEGEKSGSSRSQIRGVLSGKASLERGSVLVSSGGENLVVKVPLEIRILCMSETITGSRGEVVDSKDVFLDFSRSQNAGTVVDGDNLLEYIPEGSDVTVQVEVDKEGVMTAELFVGYGCSI